MSLMKSTARAHDMQAHAMHMAFCLLGMADFPGSLSHVPPAASFRPCNAATTLKCLGQASEILFGWHMGMAFFNTMFGSSVNLLNLYRLSRAWHVHLLLLVLDSIISTRQQQLDMLSESSGAPACERDTQSQKS